VLPERYQQWITAEINRILRDLEKVEGTDSQKHGDSTQQAVWRRENDIRSELEKSKSDLCILLDKALETEKRCEYLKQQAIITEEKEKQALMELEKTIAAKIQNIEDPSLLTDEYDDRLSAEDTQHDLFHMNKVASKGNNIDYSYNSINTKFIE
jgi:WNK lysine deficient protein kinase